MKLLVQLGSGTCAVHLVMYGFEYKRDTLTAGWRAVHETPYLITRFYIRNCLRSIAFCFRRKREAMLDRQRTGYVQRRRPQHETAYRSARCCLLRPDALGAELPLKNAMLLFITSRYKYPLVINITFLNV